VSHGIVWCVICDSSLSIGLLSRKMSMCSPNPNLRTPHKLSGKKIRKSLSFSFMSKFGKWLALRIVVTDSF
jgi:hypothetical protein